MIRDASAGELPALQKLISEGLDLGFDPRPVAEEKLFGPGFGGDSRCRVASSEGELCGVAVTCGSSVRLLVVARHFRGRGIGSELLQDATDWIGNRFSRVTIAAAAGNYLVPGVPAQDEETLRFFAHRGYAEHARSTDMVVDLRAVETSRPSGVRLQVVRTYGRDLEAFLREGFGEAIAWEIEHGIGRGGSVVRIALDGDQIAGFSACEVNNAGLGTFGPQGVADRMRGRGLGSALLLASLTDLRSLGFGQARIPWVSSVSYYERSCGARIAGEYVVLRRTL